MIRRFALLCALVMATAVLATGCFPNVNGSDTGPRAGHTLSSPTAGHYFDSGNCATGCSVTDETIVGDVYVDGVNVTISDSAFDGDLDGAGSNPFDTFGVKTLNGGTVSIQYSSFKNYATAAIFESNWSCNFCQFTHMQNDGVVAGANVSLTNSLMKDFDTVAPNHADGVQIQAGGVHDVLIQNNTIALTTNQNSAIFDAPDFGNGAGPVTIDNNFLGGGNYTVYIVDGANGTYHITTQSLTNNHFWYGSYSYGPLDVTETLSPVCGNVWDDTETTTPMDTPYGDSCS
jgi:hypothetical protein